MLYGRVDRNLKDVGPKAEIQVNCAVDSRLNGLWINLSLSGLNED
jgi:hypothetical protein